LAEFDHGSSVSKVICEQVSHHPPISSAFVENVPNHVQIEATAAWKASFSLTNMQFLTLGRTIIRLTNLNEEYVMKQPGVLAQFAFLFGTPIAYTYGDMSVACEKTGYQVQLFFHGEDKIKGKVLHKGTVVNKLSGNYFQMYIKDAAAKSKKDAHKQLIFKVEKQEPRMLFKVKPIEQQAANESRKVWRDCTNAIFFDHDFDKATMAKYTVEEEQRTLEKKRIADGVKWQPHYFEAENGVVIDNTQMYLFKKKHLEEVRPEQLHLD